MSPRFRFVLGIVAIAAVITVVMAFNLLDRYLYNLFGPLF